MRLSQGQLNLLETCPRKFQHTYLEQLASPSTPEQQERMMSGSRFHLLMQQWEMGLPVELLVQADRQLDQWFTSFVAAAPQILGLGDDRTTFRQSEHQRTLEVDGHLLVVVYDLLVLSEQHAQILDWKTYPKPLQSKWLAKNWQTRLYPYVLAETSHYPPEQIAINYWFFQSKTGEDTEPQSLRFAYNTAIHQQTQRDLMQLVQKLSQWLDRYETTGEPFPQVAEGSKHCADCSFATRCQRGDDRKETISTPLPNLAEIEEIAL
jgi:PD-(D/E)XK nuclease superfamily